MKLNKMFFCLALSVILTSPVKSFAIPATADDVTNFKQDFMDNKILIGKSRLKDIQRKYGEPADIINTDKKIVYEYGNKELKVEFEKNRYWRTWSYDSFKPQAYTDKINDLRKKLEGQKIAGENIKLDKFIKDYDPPTEAYPTEQDGAESIYYYGNMRLVFENVFILKSVTGKKLMKTEGASMASEEKSEKKDVKNAAPAAEAPQAANPVKTNKEAGVDVGKPLVPEPKITESEK